MAQHARHDSSLHGTVTYHNSGTAAGKRQCRATRHVAVRRSKTRHRTHVAAQRKVLQHVAAMHRRMTQHSATARRARHIAARRDATHPIRQHVTARIRQRGAKQAAHCDTLQQTAAQHGLSRIAADGTGSSRNSASPRFSQWQLMRNGGYIDSWQHSIELLQHKSIMAAHREVHGNPWHQRRAAHMAAQPEIYADL